MRNLRAKIQKATHHTMLVALVLPLLATVMTATLPGMPVALAAAGAIDGTVFRDANFDGALTGGGAGIGGITVSGLDANGNSVAAVTGGNGTYRVH